MKASYTPLMGKFRRRQMNGIAPSGATNSAEFRRRVLRAGLDEAEDPSFAVRRRYLKESTFGNQLQGEADAKASATTPTPGITQTSAIVPFMVKVRLHQVKVKER